MKKTVHIKKSSKRKLRPSLHMHPLFSITIVTLCILIVIAVSHVLAAKPQPISGQFEMEDVTSNGIAANTGARAISVSRDGRYILFESSASNLGVAAPDTTEELFVRDTATNTTELVSILPDGSQETYHPDNGYSAFISSDGRYVGFESVDGSQIYLRDRTNQTTVFITDTHGFFYMTPNASYIVYSQQNSSNQSIYNDWVFNTQTDSREELTVNSSGEESNTYTEYPIGQLSDDGRYFVFASNATNLVAGHTTTRDDIYIRDRQAGTTTYVYQNVYPDCSTNNPHISADARFVLFSSCASNLVAKDSTPTGGDTFLLDRQTGAIQMIDLSDKNKQATSSNGPIDLTDDGRYVLFGAQDPDFNPYRMTGQTVYLRDTLLGSTELIGQNPTCKSVVYGGSSEFDLNRSITNDGRFVLFETSENNIVSGDTNGLKDVFLRDRFVPFNKLSHTCQ